MSALFGRKKSSALDKRIQKIQEQMDNVDHDLRILSKFVEKPSRPMNLSKLKSVAVSPAAEPVPAVMTRIASPLPARRAAPVSRPVSSPPPLSRGPAPATAPVAVPDPKLDARGGYRPANAYDERFADYLASSFQGARPLRQERRIQRNKAIAMIVVVVFLLFWALCRFLQL